MMRHLRQSCAALTLACAFTVPAIAGEISCGVANTTAAAAARRGRDTRGLRGRATVALRGSRIVRLNADGWAAIT